tara:strand:+ start:729 stop:983 length:255 start_codon:yes stop_codon:yes gene_type:complete
MGTFRVKRGEGDVVTFDYNSELTDVDRERCIARAERNAFLADTDRYMVEDFPTTQKENWKIYRQALRDMDFSDPYNLNWPTKPE